MEDWQRRERLLCFGRGESHVGYCSPAAGFLRSCECTAVLSGCNGVLAHVGEEQAALLSRSAFGQPVEPASTTSVKEGPSEQRFLHFQVGPEEMFYLLHAVRCITVVKPEMKGRTVMSEGEVWRHLCSARQGFPELYKAYSHLRRRHWVVRSGLQYGADFVAYRHHPALVHSEYAVVVVGDRPRGRLAAWPDLLCALRGGRQRGQDAARAHHCLQ